MSGCRFWSQAEPQGYQPAWTPACWYSLFWHPVFLATTSNVPQVTVPDIDVHLRHNPSVPIDLFNKFVMFS